MKSSTEIQHIQIIRWLLATSLTSVELRDRYILSFAARINELRRYGFYILTIRQEYIDGDGDKRTIGRYLLLNDKNYLNKRGQKILEKAMAA